MLPLTYRRRWQFAGIALLILVLAAAMAPELWPWGSHYQPGLSMTDKWLHGITFAGLALWYTGQYARRYYWWLTLGLLAFGALIEFCQSLVSYRTSEWGDMGADALGVMIGMLIATLVTGGWSVQAEQWLQKRVD